MQVAFTYVPRSLGEADHIFKIAELQYHFCKVTVPLTREACYAVMTDMHKYKRIQENQK